LLDGISDAAVGLGDGVAQRAHEVADAAVFVQRLHRADDDLAGDLACRVPAHAVGDREQPRSCVHGVLVVAAYQTEVRTHCIA
jgi:hypothetical protein